MEDFRQKGNDRFRSAQENVPVVVKRERYMEAIKLYNQAIASKPTDLSEKALCLKNKGVCHAKLVEILNETKDEKEISYNAKEAVSDFAGAIHSGHTTQTSAWIENVRELYMKCIQTAWDKLHHIGVQQQLCEQFQRALRPVTIPVPERNRAWFHLADKIFKLGVTIYEKENIPGALQMFHDCDRPLLEAGVNSSSSDLRDSIMTHICICEGKVELKRGLSMLEQSTLDVTNDTTSKWWELLWDSVDAFRQAIIRSRDRDIATEAQAYAVLGKIFHTYRINNARAKQYCEQSVSLVESLEFSKLKSTEWYLDCKRRISEITETEPKATSPDDSESRPIPAWADPKLKEALRVLREKEHSYYEYLRHVYSVHPPKNPEHKLVDPLTSSNVKKAMLTAISHYHPDKNVANEEDYESKVWYFLCEEITKILNNFYDQLKGV